MKNLKRIISTLLAFTMIFALSVTCFAVDSTAGYYTIDMKFVDESGNQITDLVAGSTATLEVSFYETTSKNGITLANGNYSFQYKIKYSGDLVADKNVSTTVGTCSTSLFAPKNEYTLTNVLSGTISTKPVSKHTLNIGQKVGTYTLTWNTAGFSLQEGESFATSPVANSLTVNVVAAGSDKEQYTAVSTLADAAKTAIEAKFGTGKYYYKGDAITFTTDANNTPLYLKATDGETTKATNASLQAHLNLGANVTGKVVPVLILSDSEGPAYDFIVE